MRELACFRIVEFDEYQKKHIMLMREIAQAVTKADKRGKRTRDKRLSDLVKRG